MTGFTRSVLILAGGTARFNVFLAAAPRGAAL